MLEEFCMKITNKIQHKHPKLSEENVEIINFILLVLFGEIPKIIMIFLIAWWLKILTLTLITFVAMAIYRTQSGGFHLEGHMSCFLFSLFVFCGTGLFAKEMLNWPLVIVMGIYAIGFTFSAIAIYKYAPADTENFPIISKEVRRKKKVRSFLAIILLYTVALICPNKTVANICVLTTIVQSLALTPIAYKISMCEYGDITKKILGITNT